MSQNENNKIIVKFSHANTLTGQNNSKSVKIFSRKSLIITGVLLVTIPLTITFKFQPTLINNLIINIFNFAPKRRTIDSQTLNEIASILGSNKKIPRTILYLSGNDETKMYALSISDYLEKNGWVLEFVGDNIISGDKSVGLHGSSPLPEGGYRWLIVGAQEQ